MERIQLEFAKNLLPATVARKNIEMWNKAGAKRSNSEGKKASGHTLKQLGHNFIGETPYEEFEDWSNGRKMAPFLPSPCMVGHAWQAGHSWGSTRSRLLGWEDLQRCATVQQSLSDYWLACRRTFPNWLPWGWYAHPRHNQEEKFRFHDNQFTWQQAS